MSAAANAQRRDAWLARGHGEDMAYALTEIDALVDALVELGEQQNPAPGDAGFHVRHRRVYGEAVAEVYPALNSALEAAWLADIEREEAAR